MPQIQADPVLSSLYLPTTPSQPVFGLVLTVLHPAPSFLESFYSTFRSRLQSLLRASDVPDTSYLLYPPESLHCTIATLRPFRKPTPEHPENTIRFWADMLERAAQMPDWPRASELTFAYLRDPKVFGNGVGVLLHDDWYGAIGAMRNCLREAFAEQKGRNGTADFATDDVDMGDVKIPDIVHSTVLRWRASPSLCTEQLQSVFDDAYGKAVVANGMERMLISEVCLLREWEPFMQKLTCCKTLPLLKKKDCG